MNPTNEIIDERILRILNLLDVFDLDYETYITLLKEKLVEITSSRKKIPTEEFELLKNEFKRVKGKKGRFKPKAKKPINSKNISSLSTFKSKGSSIAKIQEKNVKITEGLLGIVQSIRKTVESIHKSVLLQSSLDKKEFEKERRGKEQSRRRGEEGRLESTKEGIFEKAKKILSPIESVFDRLNRFLFFTILGRTFKLFFDWASNPQNKKKVEVIGKFLKDWWPALLGAWFLFANPLGKFVRSVVGTVTKLSFKLAKFAIPKLLSFTKSNPLIAAGVVTGVAAGTGYMMEQNRMDEIGKKQGSELEKRGQGNWWNEIGKSFNPGQLGMGGISPMNVGGSVFSGLVDRNTGTTVSGAGVDTQFLPIEGGGGAVLQRGESVLQVGARERMIKETGYDPLSFNVGSNANKPRSINSNVLSSAYGGLIGLSNGGAIGLAAHHLKQDEALSSLTPGINDFTRPGSSKWSKVTVNTPIHSYVDSVGQTTIGWGSTYYDSILNGKKPVRMGDKISKGRADDILSNNIAGLAKEYSTKIPNWDKMTDKQKASLLLLGYNAPYGPLGAYPKLTEFLKKGDIRSAAQNLQRSGPNKQRIDLEKNLLMSGPLNMKNIVGPKMVGEKKVGSGIPFIPPFMYKKKGGGSLGPNGEVNESSGYKNPHSSEDRRFVPLSLHPDEVVKVFTKDFVDRGGLKILEYLQAVLDPDSNARKDGILSNSKLSRFVPGPPLSRRETSAVTLPTITQSSGQNSYNSSSRGPQVPQFSTVSDAALGNRNMISSVYGIVG